MEGIKRLPKLPSSNMQTLVSLLNENRTHASDISAFFPCLVPLVPLRSLLVPLHLSSIGTHSKAVSARGIWCSCEKGSAADMSALKFGEMNKTDHQDEEKEDACQSNPWSQQWRKREAIHLFGGSRPLSKKHSQPIITRSYLQCSNGRPSPASAR